MRIYDIKDIYIYEYYIFFVWCLEHLFDFSLIFLCVPSGTLLYESVGCRLEAWSATRFGTLD